MAVPRWTKATHNLDWSGKLVRLWERVHDDAELRVWQAAWWDPTNNVRCLLFRSLATHQALDDCDDADHEENRRIEKDPVAPNDAGNEPGDGDDHHEHARGDAPIDVSEPAPFERDAR